MVKDTKDTLPAIDLKLKIVKTKSLRLGINEGEKVILGKKIDPVDSFIYLGSIKS